MKKEKQNPAVIKLYEYPLYWLISLLVIFLAVPILIFKFIAYLVRSVGAPLKSVRHLLGFSLVILIAASIVTVYEINVKYNIGEQTRFIIIDEHDSFNQVAGKLKDQGILKGEYLFKYAAIAMNIDKFMIPGKYDFDGRISIYDILRKLKLRDISKIMVTIPEGCTIKKTAGILTRQLGIDSAAFVVVAFDTALIRNKYGVDNLEGYLFPETYQMWYGITIDKIIDIMITLYQDRTQDLFREYAGHKLNSHQIMTLASIIESEAMDGTERGLISSVYHNRLSDDMLLQADPTVIYGIGGLDRPLVLQDLEFDSPYNTYKYKGLPPGPINSPGLASIKAALFPDESNYLFFVADKTGSHIFTRTLEEHNQAKSSIRRKKF